MRILLVLDNCEPNNVAPLLALGRQLTGIGMEVVFALCDASTCGGCQRPDFRVPDVGCLERRLELKTLVKQKGWQAVSISRFLKQELRIDVSYYGPPPSGPSASYRHMDIWDVCKGSIFRYLQRTHLLPGDEPVVEMFCSKAAMMYEAWLALITEYKIDRVVVFQGMPYVDRTAVEAANTLGIPTFAYENSCFKSLKFFVPGNFVVNRHPLASASYWDGIKKRRLSYEDKTRVANFLEKVYSGEHNQIRQSGVESQSALYERFALSPGRKIILVLGQVPFDSVITYDSPHYPETMLFFEDVVDVAGKHPEYDFILRLHPLEATLFGNRTFKALQQREIPPNVRLVHSDQANTYQLMDISAVGVVINSQTGLEMAAKGKPVVVCGNAFYAGKGFTTEIGAREALERCIMEAAAAPSSDAASRDMLELFLHHFIFEYLKEYDSAREAFTESAFASIIGMLRDAVPPTASGSSEMAIAPTREFWEDGDMGKCEKAVRLLVEGGPAKALEQMACLESSGYALLLAGPLKMRALISSGRIQEAASLADELLEKYPHDLYIMGDSMAAYNRAGNFSRADWLMSRYRERFPQFPWGMTRYYSSLIESGESAKVAALAPGDVSDFPANAALRHMLGLALFRTGAYAEAEVELKTAIRLAPFSYWPILDLAVLHIHTGNMEDGSAELRRAIRLDPPHPDCHLAHSELLFQVGNFEETAREFQLHFKDSRISPLHLASCLVHLLKQRPSIEGLNAVVRIAIQLIQNARSHCKEFPRQNRMRVRSG